MKRLGGGVPLAMAGLVLLAALPAAGGQGSGAEAPPPKGETPEAKVILPLARVAKLPLRTYTFRQVRERFPAFEHAPFETAGFSHLTLPFHYEDRAAGGDANEAYAFAFLLSFSLDWAPGCYCTRHAYLVFQRDRGVTRKLAAEYDRGLIASAVKRWRATHAVGGTLVHHKDGYSGTLSVYDRTGAVAAQFEYDKPRGYFDLLGDAAVDAMKSLGHEPSPALAGHLRLRQCKHHRSLIDLGRAAGLKEKPSGLFALYGRILKRDPGFAAVRYWLANQRGWVDRNDKARALANGKALESHLVQEALEDFSPAKCPDILLAAQYPLWLKQAETLVGPDAPWLVTKRLEAARQRGKIAPALLARASRVAAKYPNDYPLLCSLFEAYSHGGGLPADLDTSSGIALVALGNRYLPAPGHKAAAAHHIALAGRHLGFNDLCVQMLEPLTKVRLEREGQRAVRWAARTLGEALFDMGHFDQSWRWYRTSFKGCVAGSSDAMRALVGGGVAAAHAGRLDVVRQILRDRRDLLAREGAVGLLEGYLDLLAGKRISHKAVWSRSEPRPSWLERQLTIVTIQSDLLHRKDAHWQWAEWGVKRDVHNRTFQILTHEMFHRHPQRSTDCFYEAIEWLEGDDPWARQAVAAWRRRVAEPSVVEPAELLAAVAHYPPVRFPVGEKSRRSAAGNVHARFRVCAFACGVRRLADARRFDEAEELAMRYRHLAADMDSYPVRAHANHLVHLVAKAREAAKGAIGPDDL